MQTAIIDSTVLVPEAVESVTEILTRMGWCWEFCGNDIVVNVPVDDSPLFDFIFEAVL